ncbi:hypothetical protein [Brevundimonas subvibrioides]|uniref:Lipoprotein n=1 Tax=Brevundimonas subvibrioides (strain ATCC 15264 / DSM 4735 / LMG 14903 / NBRC 16000 / CB 81) TaxID=633149 RepID=D9QG19_BRESC|nr:hypothetical protein [Brevundimonas subvibrioides]ADL02561.1 conserved hypothetical protein [Brevundimonas subvibrioides ATCC 15264]
MKRIVAAALMAGAAGLSACERTAADSAPAVEPTATSSSVPTAPSGTVATDVGAASATPAQPIVEGAPSFAVLYPGGEIDAPATVATSAAGPGGLVAFRTDADPATIVEFYRTRAEAAGLSSVMAMNMGEARSYGAAKADAGANLQVVASPIEGGQTSVQLSWSAGG